MCWQRKPYFAFDWLGILILLFGCYENEELLGINIWVNIAVWMLRTWRIISNKHLGYFYSDKYIGEISRSGRGSKFSKESKQGGYDL